MQTTITIPRIIGRSLFASERTNSYNQDVIARAHPLRMRGLKACRFAGAMRTLAQLLRRALTFVLDATYTLHKTGVAQI